ncbi:MAG: HD domain-containing phosphohydrolase [Acidobacteriota bacterium]
MSERILCVDDDPNVLQAYQRALRKMYRIETALGAEEALRLVATQGPFAVVVSDMRMPGMDGVELLTRVRQLAPNSVRMMLTGNGDLDTAMQAVNEGNVFRFLTKPCPPATFAKVLSAGLAQYRLVMAEKELLEGTVRGSVSVLCDVLSLTNPVAFGRATLIKKYVGEVAREMRLSEAWRFDIAAMLSQIGCISVPPDALERLYRREPLSLEEKKAFDGHPAVGGELIAKIPRLGEVAEIIACQEKHFDGTGLPADSHRGESIPMGARLLKAVADYLALECTGVSKREALTRLRSRPGWYDPAVLKALEAVLRRQINYETRAVALKRLQPGMILAEDVYSRQGNLLIAKGHEVTLLLRRRLENFTDTVGVEEPIKVAVPTDEH